MRLAFGHHRNRKSAAQFFRGLQHRLQDVALVQRVDEMCHHLGVGLADKTVALGLQGGTQFFVVFNDAVVHQGNAVTAEMRVGVVHRRCAVGGPPGVGNAGQALQAIVVIVDLGHQLGHPCGAAGTLQAGRLAHLRLRAVDRHPAGVITAVLQALQALHQDGNDVARGNRADDAAHICSPFIFLLWWGAANRQCWFAWHGSP